jgi:transcriptional regulator with XRE-family HTH domain
MQVHRLITDVNHIAQRLLEARLSKEWTQGQLASAAGVSQGTIGNIESGLRKNPRELLAIASALGVSPDWLKTGKGSKEPAAPTAVFTSLEDAIGLLAGLLNAMEDDQRAQVEQRMRTFIQAPDSQRAFDALVSEVSPLPTKPRKAA